MDPKKSDSVATWSRKMSIEFLGAVCICTAMALFAGWYVGGQSARAETDRLTRELSVRSATLVGLRQRVENADHDLEELQAQLDVVENTVRSLDGQLTALPVAAAEISCEDQLAECRQAFDGAMQAIELDHPGRPYLGARLEHRPHLPAKINLRSVVRRSTPQCGSTRPAVLVGRSGPHRRPGGTVEIISTPSRPFSSASHIV